MEPSYNDYQVDIKHYVYNVKSSAKHKIQSVIYPVFPHHCPITCHEIIFYFCFSPLDC